MLVELCWQGNGGLPRRATCLSTTSFRSHIDWRRIEPVSLRRRPWISWVYFCVQCSPALKVSSLRPCTLFIREHEDVIGDIPVPGPRYPPPTRDRTEASAIQARRLTFRAMGWPEKPEEKWKYFCISAPHFGGKNIALWRFPGFARLSVCKSSV